MGASWRLGGSVATAAEVQAQLDSVQAAIAALEAGSREVRRGEREYTQVDLPALYEREAFLERKLDRVGRGGIRVRQGVAY